MQKLITSVIVLSGLLFFNTINAQDNADTKRDKKTEEIIIRKKGDKDVDINVEIKGDKITINGKPLSEFVDENVTISKRKMIIKDGDGNMSFDMDGDWGDFAENWKYKAEDYKELGKKYKEKYSTPRAFLGVSTDDDEDGAKITKVTEGSAAEKAGLQEGDVITKVDNKQVDGSSSLSEIISSYQPKDKVKIHYKREGKEKSEKVILGETKNVMAFAFRGPNGNVRSFSLPTIPAMPPMPPQIEMLEDGEFRDIPRAFNFDMFPRQQKLGLKIQDTEDGSGIKVLGADKDSPAEKAGLQKDDIVIEIAGSKVSNTDDAREQLQQVQDKTSYSIKAKRNGVEMNFDIKISKKLKTANL